MRLYEAHRVSCVPRGEDAENNYLKCDFFLNSEIKIRFSQGGYPEKIWGPTKVLFNWV